LGLLEVSTLRDLFVLLERGDSLDSLPMIPRIFEKMLLWPPEFRYPLLDIMGIVVLSLTGAGYCELFVATVLSQLDSDCDFIDKCHLQCTIFALRFLCNCSRWSVCNSRLLELRDTLSRVIGAFLNEGQLDVRIRKAAVALALNHASMLQHSITEEPARIILRDALMKAAKSHSDVECSNRAVQALCVMDCVNGDVETIARYQQVYDMASMRNALNI
jgi:hypothetical protein